jgi:transposase
VALLTESVSARFIERFDVLDGDYCDGGKMQRGPRPKSITLTAEESEQLHRWARGRGVSHALKLRARIVLACDRDRPNRKVSKLLRVSTQTVGKWRARFAARRLQGLLDQPRSGAPRSISDSLVEAVVAKTLHEKPSDGAHWSSRRMAEAVGLSQTAVLRIWRAFDLEPRRAMGRKFNCSR